MKKLTAFLLTLVMVLTLAAVGTPTALAAEGKVINIYSWNTEFQTRVEAVYDKVPITQQGGASAPPPERKAPMRQKLPHGV